MLLVQEIYYNAVFLSTHIQYLKVCSDIMDTVIKVNEKFYEVKEHGIYVLSFLSESVSKLIE